MTRLQNFCAAMLAVSLLAACTSPSSSGEGLATPLPDEFMPTAVALTVQAGDLLASQSAPALSPFPQLSSTASSAQTANSTASPTFSPSPTLLPATATIFQLPTATSTATFLPVTPGANIQIYQLGELSRVSSPIKISARLFSKVGKVVRVELHGEDGRLLARELSNLPPIPWSTATLSTDLDFEISLAAEYGRLVISVEDSYGQLIDVNSVNLVLLKYGDSELNPATALWQVIQIEQPASRTMLQGGSVFVSGLARPNTDNPLFVELIGQDGQNLGHRLAAVEIKIPGGYGTFAAEVPYSVDEVTEALLVVYESGGTLSDIAHLASVQVLLSP